MSAKTYWVARPHAGQDTDKERAAVTLPQDLTAGRWGA